MCGGVAAGTVDTVHAVLARLTSKESGLRASAVPATPGVVDRGLVRKQRVGV